MDNVVHFLNYSLDKKRKIVLIYLDDAQQVVRKNVLVQAVTEDTVQVMIGKKETELARASVLGAGYARGDNGDLEKA